MSHLHIPDGVLPPVVWLIGLILAVLALMAASLATRGVGPQRIAYQSALGGLMLATMAIPVPVAGLHYCMTLMGPVGVLLGWASALQVSFVVTAILALLGQGGFTVIGLNTLVLGLGAAVARGLYRLIVPRLAAAWSVAVATAISQLVSSALWIGILWLSVQITPDIVGEHHIEESLRFLSTGLLVAVLGPLLLGAVALESLLAFGLARFLARVRPDLLPDTANGHGDERGHA